MNIKNSVTDLDQHGKKRVTLTTYASFVLTPDKGKRAFVKSCKAEIKYKTYWADLRNSIARVHNTKIPNIKELKMLVARQIGSKKLNYNLASKGYLKALLAGSIEGKKAKRYKSNVYYA